MFRHSGSRTRRLVAFLERREKAPPGRRGALDRQLSPSLFRPRAVVYTDTADFTDRTLRDGILHFLMVFNRAARKAQGVVASAGGRVVKVEADSLMLLFPDVPTAFAGVDGLEALLRRLNRRRPSDERLSFSYGIGFGDVLDLEGDVFGLEVNLASKLGEDLARPGEALLTPAAAATLDARSLRRVVPYEVVTFGRVAIPVQRLKLKRR